jgi:sodium borate transporter 11
MPSVMITLKDPSSPSRTSNFPQGVTEHVTTFKDDDEELHVSPALSMDVHSVPSPVSSDDKDDKDDKEHQETVNLGMVNKGYSPASDEREAKPFKKGRFKVEDAQHELDTDRGGSSEVSDGENSDVNSTVNSMTARKYQAPPRSNLADNEAHGNGAAHKSISIINTEEVMLVHSQLKKINVKDFQKEVRAKMDVEDFFKEGDIFLDLNPSSLTELVKHVLERLQIRERDLDVDEAIDSILNEHLDNFQNSLQGTCVYDGWIDLDQSWICGMCSLASLSSRRIAIVKLRHVMNIGPTCQEVRFLVLVMTPANSKKTKTDVEIGRTFATLFCSMQFRSELMAAGTESAFKGVINKRVKQLQETKRRRLSERKVSNVQATFTEEDDKIERGKSRCGWIGRGIRDDFSRRIACYIDDYLDGVKTMKAKTKLVSTILFLYFAILLPCLALGVTNYANTDGMMTIKRMIYAQALGGLIFAVIGGQALVIVISTAPVIIFTLIIKNISDDIDEDFFQMYAASGLCNSIFLILYSVLNACNLMKYAYRSVDEIFGVFISLAFTYDAVKSMIHIFQESYCETKLTDFLDMDMNLTTCASNLTNLTLSGAESLKCTTDVHLECSKASFMLAILLMLGTVWLGATLFNFNKSPYLDSRKRELLGDYALPFAVISFAFIASFVFRDIPSEKIKEGEGKDEIVIVQVFGLSFIGWLYSIGLGFCLSILFFMDQNISASFVNNPKNNLKKGTAYHYDLLVLAIVNIILSILGLPWIHGALPHSPLHVRALAEFEERMSQGVMTDTVVKVHETRLTSIIANVAIGFSVYLLPTPLDLIPIPVLNGVLLYVALISLNGNEFFERLLLWVTEQNAYPPNSYVRHVKQRSIHLFTLTQIGQLVVLCALGFAPWPYLKMVFPVALLAFMPFRHFIIPKGFEKTYLDALDGH